jgi:hypothetical protein
MTKSKKNRNPLLDKTFVFRPVYDKYGPWLRYDNGEWIEDDGKPGLAFVSAKPCHGAAHGLYVRMPYSEGVLWKWMDSDILKHIPGRPNPWHYYVINPDDGWGKSWDRNGHINEKVGRLAMRKCCDLHSYANGRGPDINKMNEYIKQGKLWILEDDGSLTLVTPPENPECYLCMNGMIGHYKEAHRGRLLDGEDALKRFDIEEEELLLRLDDIKNQRDYLKKQLKELREMEI